MRFGVACANLPPQSLFSLSLLWPCSHVHFPVADPDNGNRQSSGGSGSEAQPPASPRSITSFFSAQENRSFDHYFGALRQYWAQNGYPDQSFDGLPQFNPASGAAPLAGPAPTIPGCNPSQPPPADCAFDTSNPMTSFHLVRQCASRTRAPHGTKDTSTGTTTIPPVKAPQR